MNFEWCLVLVSDDVHSMPRAFLARLAGMPEALSFEVANHAVQCSGLAEAAPEGFVIEASKVPANAHWCIPDTVIQWHRLVEGLSAEEILAVARAWEE